jgi:hypothetical protein
MVGTMAINRSTYNGINIWRVQELEGRLLILPFSFVVRIILVPMSHPDGPSAGVNHGCFPSGDRTPWTYTLMKGTPVVRRYNRSTPATRESSKIVRFT